MHTNLIRTNRAMMDGWPILVAYSVYVILFCIIATTMTSYFLVA
jgi:hypothetical protein